MAIELEQLVADFARGFEAADAMGQPATSRSGRQYQPGLGPYEEDRAVELALREMQRLFPGRYEHAGQGLAYPGSRQRCDLWLGEPIEWSIEVKMARFFHDNGKRDDMSIKDLLSPFEVHRSAVTDCTKLASSSLPGRRAMLIYGFDNDNMPLEQAIAAWEVLAAARVWLGPRFSAPLKRLVHPVHSRGGIFAWEVAPR